MLKTDNQIFEEIVKSLGKSQKSLDEDVNIVKKWMQDQPHLPELLDDRSIGNFLILNKFSIERTKQKIDMYYSVKTRVEEVYGEINPKLPHMKELHDIMYCPVHPTLFNNDRIVYFKLRNENLGHKLDPLHILRYLINLYEIRLREDIFHGDMFIVDCRKVPLSYFLKITPSLIFKATILIYQGVYSSRVKGIYFFHPPPIAETIMTLAKKIMKPKIFNRIHLLPDIAELKNILPEEFVPADFGGKGPCLEKLQEILDERLKEHQQLFDRLDHLKVDESLRPTPLRDDEILGFHGNFKKLDID